MGFRRITPPQQPAAPSAANDARPPVIVIPPPRQRAVTAEPPQATAPIPPDPVPAAMSEPASKDYAVGKNKPPLHTRWKKGQSGNPKGRPKGSRNYDTRALAFFEEKVPIRTPTGEEMMDTVQLALNKLREKVGKGDMKAIDRTLDESRRLMPAPPVAAAAVDVAAQLSPAEQQILASLLESQGLTPMVIGKPRFVESDVAEAKAEAAESAEPQDGIDDAEDDYDDDRDEWETDHE